MLGKFFAEGTVLSAPTCTAHRDSEVWGNDAAFRPELWCELDQARIQEIFLAMVTLRIFNANIFRLYIFILKDPNGQVSDLSLMPPPTPPPPIN